MKLFEELPTILPIYTEVRNQNRHKENVKRNCEISLFSPHNAFLPFMIRIPKDSERPTSWKIFNLHDEEVIDISNNISLLKGFKFDDFSFAFYNGNKLIFKHETIEQDLNLNGSHYFVIEIDNVKYYSEVFKMCSEISDSEFSNRFVKIEYWDNKDIEPIRYRNEFKQVVYFDTFIHESEPTIEEETETDGFGNKIPTFQKMVIKQKIEVIVPDFLKIALVSMQMHENVLVYEQNKRFGKIDRTYISPTSEDNGSFATIEMNFETDILMKDSCTKKNKSLISEIWI